MTEIHAKLEKDQVFLSTSERDLRILETYGALKVRGKQGVARMPYRYNDLERMIEDHLELIPDPKLAERMAIDQKRDQTIRYLQAAQKLSKTSAHPAWNRLMPHQHVGVGYLTITPRAFLVYSPRLGKTPTSVVAAELLGLTRILFVTPKTLFRTIGNTIKQWSEQGQDAEVLISKGAPPTELPLDRTWIITNPESITRNREAWLAFAKDQGVELIIWDESILYKSHKAQRQQAAVLLSRQVPRVWLLTGNPSGKYMDQLFGQLQILRPEVFTSYWRFVNNWCYTTDTPWATEITGNRNPEKLRHYLRDMMISRTPEEVPVLPELQFETVEVELSKEQEKLIDDLNLTMQLRNPENPEEPTTLTNILTLMTRTAQLVNCPQSLGFDIKSGKQDAALELIESSEKPVLVWFKYVESLKHFARVCRAKKLTVAEVHGGVSDRNRDVAISDFNAGRADIICVQLQTGKFGLDLTAAKTIIYYERDFDLDSWIQSTNRGRLINMSQDRVAAGYVLHGGYSDYIVDKILLRKVGSLSEMGLSDLLDVTRSTSSRKKVRKSAKSAVRSSASHSDKE